MKYIKAFEALFDPRTGTYKDTGDMKMGEKNSDEKLKFMKLCAPLPIYSISVPRFVENLPLWAADQIVKLLETSHSSEYGSIGNVKMGSVTNVEMVANKYSRCFIQGGTLAAPGIIRSLKNLLAELKTKDEARIKESVESFFNELSPKLSDNSVKRLDDHDVKKFETLCSYILEN